MLYPISQQRQVRHHAGEDDRGAGVRPARGPDGGQTQDGHDRLRQPHARRLCLITANQVVPQLIGNKKSIIYSSSIHQMRCKRCPTNCSNAFHFALNFEHDSMKQSCIFLQLSIIRKHALKFLSSLYQECILTLPYPSSTQSIRLV